MPDPVIERPYHHGSLRAALLDAAERRLRADGADRLSLRDLAREVGVSHGAPRRHFADRQALLDALAESGFARLDRELRDALAGAGEEFEPRLHAAATAYARFATESASLLDVMYAGKHRPGADRILAAASAPFGLLRRLVRQGQGEGVLVTDDLDRVATVLLATLQGIASFINGGVVEPEHRGVLVEAAVDQFLHGAGPR
ncbi:TetR/AcrR family transcriptional regulator [Isoptericola sp. NPDC056618]|uniref:TetR/AcrR family transcriptional regulator n=1 Tax=Isoptericola sp. NPDC056618 TaxID=3345878 RepID=UPI0036A3C989